MNEEQRDIWRVIWEIAQTYPVEKPVGYYHVHQFSEGIRVFVCTITVLSRDRDRWLSFREVLCAVEMQTHPYHGVMRDLFALPLNEESPAPRLRAGKLLWFLKQFSLLRMIPGAEEVGLPGGRVA